jgi:hypothetical protein
MESLQSESDDAGPRRFLSKIAGHLNFKQKIEHIKYVIKTKGWSIAGVIIGFEIVEHVCIPSALAYIFGPEYLATASVPWGEFLFYPILLKYLA